MTADDRLTRRSLLAAAGGGALGLALGPAASALAGRRSASLATGGLQPELITVTDTGMAAWWPTDAPADTTLRIARADGGPVRDLRLERRATVHVAELDGLKPGTRYRYELRSGGQAMPRGLGNPGTFTTLDPPEGDLLATVAVINDMHVGEGCSGTAVTVADQSLPPCFSTTDYAYRMTEAAVEELRRRGDVDLVIANGDLTDRGRSAEVARALELLGRLRPPVAITRGNHDRRLTGPEGCADDGDCLRAQAYPERPPGDHALAWVRRVGARVGVVGLDSCDPDTGDGRLDLGGQLAFLDRSLTELRAEGRIALVAFHHHVTQQANTTHPPPVVFGVRPDRGGREALAILGRHPHVALVLHGHTHRNYVSYDPASGLGMPFLENGAAKEYPGGYAVLRVHEDAVVRTFHRPDTPFTREWVKTTAGQVWGRQSDYTRGTLESRAFVHRLGAPLPDPRPSILGPL